MKLLIIPIIIALFAGIGGGSGYAYMRASKAYVADSAQRADSLKANPPKPHADEDSTATDPELHDVLPDDSTAHEELEPETPADSLRALALARASLKESTKGMHDATPVPAPHDTPADHNAKPARAERPARTAKPDPAHAAGDEHAAKPEAGVKAAPAHTATAPSARVAKPTGEHAPTSPTGVDSSHGASTQAAPVKHADKPTPPSTGVVAAALRDARNDAMATALPEQRLAKIFGAMQAKEAAKVLDQMADDDVRTILSMMSDRQAAAILSTFPAARAAAIARGATRPPEIKP